MNIEISLSDERYFRLFIGKRVLFEDLFESNGTIPLFSANVHHPFGYIHKSNITDFSTNHILWGIDGNFEFSIKPKEEVFATTDHCGTIKILDDKILPEFLLYQLEQKKYEYGFDRTLRASITNMCKVTIKIPINADGSLNRDLQYETTQKYLAIKEIRQELKMRIDELNDSIIEIEKGCRCEKVNTSRIFNFPKTNSGITKEFCLDKKIIGPIPVYGCSRSEKDVMGHIKDNLKGVRYYEDCIAWNRNGASTGYFFYRLGRFTTNEDHRVMEIKPDYRGQLYEPYLRYILRNEVRKLGYGWENKLGKARIADINIEIPLGDDGSFDIEKQKEIANKYDKIYEMKNEIIQQLQNIVNTVVEI